MLGRGTIIGLTIAACVAIFVGVWSNAWWTASERTLLGDGEIAIGLRAIEACGAGTCVEMSMSDGIPRAGGAWRLFSNITFFLGIIGSIGLAIGVFLREVQGVDQIAPKAGWACGVLFPLAILTAVTFPGGGSPVVDFSMGYGFYLTLLGSLLGIGAGMLGAGGRGWEGNTFVPMDTLAARGPSPTAPVGTLPSIMPQPVPRDGAPPSAYDYQRQIREATATAVPARSSPKQLRKLGGASSTPIAAVDSTRKSLRFVARSIEISSAGMSVIFESGDQRDVLWSDVSAIVARQLPPDPPFDKTLMVDIVCGARVVRLLPSTQANYGALPGGAAPSSRDNLRKLAAMIEVARPGVVEGESRPFCSEGRTPPLFQAMKQFAAYDTQYEA